MKYTGRGLETISFPLGGIGTGSVGFSGTGRLIDWEIFGRPDKNSYNGFTHFAVKTEADGVVEDVRVLQADFPPHYIGSIGTDNIHSGFGFGPAEITMAGLPHFEEAEFTGEFPMAELLLHHADPVTPEAEIRAFSPFLPGREEESSLPGAYFDITLTNKSDHVQTYTVGFSLQNHFNSEVGKNVSYQKDGCTYAVLSCTDPAIPVWQQGELCMATDCENARVQEYWYRGGWNDGLETYWRDFSAPGPIRERRYSEAYSNGQNPFYDVAVLTASGTAEPEESITMRFVLSWYFPVILKSWEKKYHPERPIDQIPTLKQYYGTVLNGAGEAAERLLANGENWTIGTDVFRRALNACTLTEEERDAVSSNLSVLRSPTVMRLENGAFYGFEGVMYNAGACEGTCQHVWNYACALPYLFPKLEQSLRDLELKYSTEENGRMHFRLMLPLGSPMDHDPACVDGQMGELIRFYREYQINGDKEWLAGNWDKLEKIMAFAWSPENSNRWDPEKTGLLTGQQHHTLDMELFGANGWLEGYYLAALLAMSEMAKALDLPERAEEYLAIYRQGRAQAEKELFNGSYFYQKIDLSDASVLEPYRVEKNLFGDDVVRSYWNEEAGQIKYQVGNGCVITQLDGQWHADALGLGSVYDEEMVRSALKSLWDNNFTESVREKANLWRLYVLNDEGGAYICTWPDEKPAIPLTYNSEMMTGFEYVLAELLIRHGMVEEGRRLVKKIRERYDGLKRNPYNEIECGSNYARSMASFGLLRTYSGYTCDAAEGRLSFAPIPEAIAWGHELTTLWFTGTAWGMAKITADTVKLTVLDGCQDLRKVTLNDHTWTPAVVLRTGESVELS